MSDYVLTCCSTSDLSHEYFKERNIGVTYFTFELGGTEYPDDMGRTIPPKELFRRMLEGEDTKTSQVSVGQYTEFFEPTLRKARMCFILLSQAGFRDRAIPQGWPQRI